MSTDTKHHITPTEKKILLLIREGLSSKEVAGKIGVSKRTVDFHLWNMYLRWGVNNRLKAVRHAERNSLITVPKV